MKWTKPAAEPVISIPSLIDDFFGRDMEELFGLNSITKTTVPAVNIKETNESFAIELAAPGMKKENFNIEVESDTLIISAEAEHKQEESGKENNYTRREFSYQAFKRTFTLPQMVEGEKISASYVDGMLNIVIPKKEEAKEKPVRKIEIK